MMKRQSLNILVDSLALVGLVFLIANGLFLKFILPSGSGQNIGVWGLTKHEWGDIHFWIAVLIIVVVTTHLALHWQWIVCAIKKKPREGSGIRVGLGVAGLITLMLISLAPFFSPKEQLKISPQQELKQHQKGKHEDTIKSEIIRGSMTLGELEQSTTVPTNHLLKELGISENISQDQKLGQLRQKYGFDMERVRRIIKKYHKK